MDSIRDGYVDRGGVRDNGDRGRDGGGKGGRRDNIDGDDRAVALAEGSGSGAGGLQGGASSGRSHLTGGVPDTQGFRRLPQHRPSGCAVEGSDGDSQSTVHSLH